MNFSITENNSENDLKTSEKREILVQVIGLNEPINVKDEIIYYIDKKFQNNENSVNSVEELVKEAHEYISTQLTKKAINEKELEHKKEISNIETNYSARLIDERKTSYEQGMQEGIKKALEDENKRRREEHIKMLMSKATNKANILHIVYIIIMILLLLIFVIGVFRYIYFVGTLDITDNIKIQIDLFKWVVGIIYTAVAAFVYKKIFKSLNKHEIEDSIYKKYIKQLDMDESQ